MHKTEKKGCSTFNYDFRASTCCFCCFTSASNWRIKGSTEVKLISCEFELSIRLLHGPLPLPSSVLILHVNLSLVEWKHLYPSQTVCFCHTIMCKTAVLCSYKRTYVYAEYLLRHSCLYTLWKSLCNTIFDRTYTWLYTACVIKALDIFLSVLWMATINKLRKRGGGSRKISLSSAEQKNLSRDLYEPGNGW